jgi:collagenase-like PrtC family protease
MILLDVPFIPAPDYIAFIKEQCTSLYSIHFSLFLKGVPDGRHPDHSQNFAALAAGLRQIEGVKKYALLNSRFHHPSFYTDHEFIKPLQQNIEQLLCNNDLDGITLVDFYLLQALSDHSPELAAELEAVPGVNCMLDSHDRIYSYLQTIERSHFKLPAKLNLDRSLNRTPAALKDLSSRLRKTYPDIKLTLLANEGCLFRCPFKLSHDAQIAFANTGCAANETYTANEDLGCIRTLREHPEEIFKSPFIRPEDVNKYEGIIDIIKLCGRTLGPDFLTQVTTAYKNRQYQGNLLDLMDTMEWLQKTLYIDNRAIPKNFLQMISTCSRTCSSCDYCTELIKQTTHDRPLSLNDYRPKTDS